MLTISASIIYVKDQILIKWSPQPALFKGNIPQRYNPAIERFESEKSLPLSHLPNHLATTDDGTKIK